MNEANEKETKMNTITVNQQANGFAVYIYGNGSRIEVNVFPTIGEAGHFAGILSGVLGTDAEEIKFNLL